MSISIKKDLRKNVAQSVVSAHFRCVCWFRWPYRFLIISKKYLINIRRLMAIIKLRMALQEY
jgi:hypothetical protein